MALLVLQLNQPRTWQNTNPFHETLSCLSDWVLESRLHVMWEFIILELYLRSSHNYGAHGGHELQLMGKNADNCSLC